MKIRILFICLTLLFSIQLLSAQDYFVYVLKNDNQSFKYSEDVVMNLVDEKGNNRLIKKNDAITVRGNYTLEVKNVSGEEIDRIKIKGGVLEIFVLPVDIRSSEKYEAVNDSIVNKWNKQIESSLPSLERKEITKSEKIENNYNILLVLDGGFVFKFEDGKARAWEDGDEIDVSSDYLLQTSKGVLQINYNPVTLETSWKWE